MELRKRNNIFIIIGILLVIVGITVYVVSFMKQLNDDNEVKINIDEYLENTTVSELVTSSDDEIEVRDEKETLMILEIPKISIKRNIYYQDSKYNSVEYNIQILKDSDMPDIKNGNVIFASHNGNSKVSFFKKLYKLSLNDEIILYYDGYKYIYKLSKIYDINKDGTAEIYRNNNVNCITLITCKKNIKDKQEIYIGYFDRKEEY